MLEFLIKQVRASNSIQFYSILFYSSNLIESRSLLISLTRIFLPYINPLIFLFSMPCSWANAAGKSSLFLQFLQLLGMVQRKAGVFFPTVLFLTCPVRGQAGEAPGPLRTTCCVLGGLLHPTLCRASMPGPQHSASSWDQPGLPTRRFCLWFENSIYLLWVTIVTCGSRTVPLLLLGWVILSNAA